jgi:hypothetical protein
MSDFRPVIPRMRLRVGVTGHRLGPKLSPEAASSVRATAERVLAAIASSARETVTKKGAGLIEKNFELVVISALAEGADRIAAEAGHAAGFALEAVLPMARTEYVRDFDTTASREAFEAMVAAAAAVFELDGTRAHADRAYEAAGLVTLANSDLLLAVWDEQQAAGVGGTALIVDRAVNEGIPVVLVNPAAPERAHLLWAGDAELTPARVRHEDLPRRDALAEMPRLVDFLTAPPTAGDTRADLKEFLDETERRWSFGPWFALLAFFFGGRWMRVSDFQMPPYLANARAQWADYFATVRRSDRLAAAIEEMLLPAFAAADNLSVRYARVYRSAYVFNYIAAAAVATLAVFGLLLHEREWPGLVRAGEVIELIVIGAVILTWWTGHRREWHRRWLEYRRLAESLRHMRVISLTSSVGPMARPGWSPGAESDWVDWYVRAIRRLLPLPNQRVDAAYLQTVRRAASDVELRNQIDYHEPNAVLMQKLDRRLHAFGMVLFVSTAFALASLLLLPQKMHEARTILIFLTVALPVFGSAFNAIRAQSEFNTVAIRSLQTARRLTAIKRALADEKLTFARLADRVEMASDMMLDDLVEWQLVFRTRPLSLPV